MAEESGCALVVPYPDHGLISQTVADLLGDPERRAKLSLQGIEFGRTKLDVSHIAPAVADWIMRAAA